MVEISLLENSDNQNYTELLNRCNESMLFHSLPYRNLLKEFLSVRSYFILAKESNISKWYNIDLLEATDDQLVSISQKMGLALDLSEMQRIKTYFTGKKRNPTDIELQALEHMA